VTTYTQFQPSPRETFAFSATLDGTVYQMVVMWNLFGQRWFLNCVATNNVLMFSVPVIGSPAEGDINLVGPYFQQSTLVFRTDTQQFEQTP
jgi:hypothetical protein